MNKILGCTLFLVSVATGAQAQISAGTVLLGGNMGYYRSSDKNSSGGSAPEAEVKYRQFQGNPQAGFFVRDNLALGINGNFNAEKYQYPTDPTRRFLEYSVGPFARYYKFFGDTRFALAGTLGAGYRENWDKYKWYDPRANFHGHGGYASFVPSVVFFPTPKLGLEASVGGINYTYFRNKREAATSIDTPRDAYTSQRFGADFGLDKFTIGASLYLGRK